MYFWLTRAVRSRLIHELQDSFAKHPEFNKIVPFIQSKFAYEDKPQYGIVIKSTSASKVQLSADNFIGTVISYCQKANVEGFKGDSVEWVTEDKRAVMANGGVFPSPPGTYYIELETANSFNVNPLYEVKREFLLEVEDGMDLEGHTVTLEHVPHEGSLLVYVDNNWLLREGTHYTVDYATGILTFTSEFETYTRFYARYSYAGESSGPHTIDGHNTFNYTAIPGVNLAFGRRMEAGDQLAIIVTDKRAITAQEYGGQWQISVSFDVLARDPMQLEEIADMVWMYLWGEKKERLEFEGLVIEDFSSGGEADEVYDEAGQDMWYVSSMDLTIRTDWAIHIPVPFWISGIEFVEGSVQDIRTLTDAEIAVVPSSLHLVANRTPNMARTGRAYNFERIG